MIICVARSFQVIVYYPMPRASRFLPAVFLTLFSLIWASALSLRPRDGAPLAAIFPPFTSGETSLAAAIEAGAGEILAFGGRPFIILLPNSAPDLIRRLHQQGAIVTVRAPLLTDCLR